MLTIDCLCHQLRRRCLTGTSGSAEQIRMSHAVMHNLISDRRHNMFLSFDLLERVRSPLPVQCHVRHKLPPTLYMENLIQHPKGLEVALCRYLAGHKAFLEAIFASQNITQHRA